jgi:hypothetical protein
MPVDPELEGLLLCILFIIGAVQLFCWMGLIKRKNRKWFVLLTVVGMFAVGTLLDCLGLA